MSKIIIDKDIPPPENKPGPQTKYPWADMDVGDSFFAEGKSTNHFSTTTKRYRDKGWKFTTRTVDGGTRVWRIK